MERGLLLDGLRYVCEIFFPSQTYNTRIGLHDTNCYDKSNFLAYVHCIDVITGMNLPRTLNLSFELAPRNNNLDVINRLLRHP